MRIRCAGIPASRRARCLSAPLIGSAAAQAYPSRSVRIIVPVGAGGANDTSTRLIAQKLSESLKQHFYVENILGAGGNIGMGQAVRAAPDGYTMLSAAPSLRDQSDAQSEDAVRSGAGFRAGDADVRDRRR